jgi:hypothetical protein
MLSAHDSEIITARGVNGTSLNARFNTIEDELSAAHESTALGKTGQDAYGSLDARFEAIEEELTS